MTSGDHEPIVKMASTWENHGAVRIAAEIYRTASTVAESGMFTAMVVCCHGSRMGKISGSIIFTVGLSGADASTEQGAHGALAMSR